MQQSIVVNAQDYDDDEIDLLGMFGTMIDHKWLIMAITVIFMIVGIAYALLASPIYQANALVQVESKKNDLLGFSDVSSMLGKESPSTTEIELIRSRAIIGETVDKLQLDIVIVPNYFPVVGEFISRRFKGTAQGEVASPWLGMNSFAWGGESLKVSQLNLPESLLGKKLTLVAGDSGDYVLLDEDGNLLVEGERGQAVNQRGIKLQIDELRANPGTKFSVVRNPRLNSILEYQDALDVLERGKESGILNLSLESKDARKSVKILNTIAELYVRQNVQRTSAEAAQSLDFLREKLPEIKKDLEKAGNALNQYQTRNKSVDISLETKSILEQMVNLDTNISNMKLQQAEMDRKFTPEHPAYRALLTQIGELTEKQKMLERKVTSLPATQQELLSLTRDVEVGTEVYTQLLNKSQELDVMRAGTVGNVRLIDTADVNIQKPVKPKKFLIVLGATLFGGFFAVALVTMW
jgi:tyrosine-protein kinase Etk/Wzc